MQITQEPLVSTNGISWGRMVQKLGLWHLPDALHLDPLLVFGADHRDQVEEEGWAHYWSSSLPPSLFISSVVYPLR